jgi:hypothetical protein
MAHPDPQLSPLAQLRISMIVTLLVNLILGLLPGFVGFLLAYPPQSVWRTLGAIMMAFSFGLAVSQFLYLGPLLWWLRRKGHMEPFRGVLAAAILTVLLNSPCFIGMLSSMRN